MSMDDGRVVSNFIVQAIKNEPLTIYGDGAQTRSFCYVSDLISGLVDLFFTDDINEPVNLGNPEPIQIKKLAQEIIQLTGSNSEVINLSLPEDDPTQRQPCIEKARKMLNWNPVVNREAGLIKTIEYFNGILV
jgi:UDP-glucuronate decarboxylase